jgi:hypothetical protein
MSDCNWPTCGCRHNLTGGPWCKATVRPSITWTVFQPAAAIAALAMRERASKMIETHVLETQYDGSRVVVPSNLAKEDQHHRSLAKAIRALPTTFTAAELLAAAMQLPEVRSLVEAVRAEIEVRNLFLSTAPDRGGSHGPKGMRRMALENAQLATVFAIAPFMKGGEL